MRATTRPSPVKLPLGSTCARDGGAYSSPPKAIVHAGFGEALARHAELEWQNVPFWRGPANAGRYGVPDHARGQRPLHVRVTWRDGHGDPLEVAGPIVLGRSRFTGGGLFAPEPSYR